MPESAYDRERKRTCERCAKGLIRHPNGNHVAVCLDRNIPDWYPCTAPTLAEFAEQQAARVRELEVIWLTMRDNGSAHAVRMENCELADALDALSKVRTNA